MTTLRFDFPRECVGAALERDWRPVLNVGCKEDPAHLKALNGERVINCDLTVTDSDYLTANPIDVLFDCTGVWPFDDRSAALVVMGDILEHLTVDEIARALREARRVAVRLCVTVPRDETSPIDDGFTQAFQRGAKHRTVVTEALLREQLDAAGWRVVEWRTVDYGLWPEGYFVEAS